MSIPRSVRDRASRTGKTLGRGSRTRARAARAGATSIPSLAGPTPPPRRNANARFSVFAFRHSFFSSRERDRKRRARTLRATRETRPNTSPSFDTTLTSTTSFHAACVSTFTKNKQRRALERKEEARLAERTRDQKRQREFRGGGGGGASHARRVNAPARGWAVEPCFAPRPGRAEEAVQDGDARG